MLQYMDNDDKNKTPKDFSLRVCLCVGRVWYPGGPYNPSGRGSFPRRSTFIYDSKYLPLSQ